MKPSNPTRFATNIAQLFTEACAQFQAKVGPHQTQNAAHDAQLQHTLSQYFNIRFIEDILQQGKPHIAARNPQNPPSDTGLMAIVAYTSCGLDQTFARVRQALHAQDPNPNLRKLIQDIQPLESLIARTLMQIQPTPAKIVRRNMVLNHLQIQTLQAQGEFQFNPITSVTLHSQQVYQGGNADLILHLKTGVVDVAPLSVYGNTQKPIEREGLIIPDSKFTLLRFTPGKENGKGSLNPSTSPAITIELQEQPAQNPV